MRIILFILLFFVSCNSKENSVQDVIKRYENEDFSKFKNLYIGTRQSNFDETIYIVAKDNLPPYFVTYNKLTHKLLIKNNLLIKTDTKDYLKENQIKYLIEAFRKYPFFSISVDKNINVYINLNEDSKTLLRANNPNNIEKYYKKYYKNWYIKD